MSKQQNPPEVMPEALKCLVHGQTRTLVDILKAMNEEKTVFNADDARERLEAYVSRNLRSGDSVAQFVIRLLFRWLYHYEANGEGINLDYLEETLSESGGDRFYMESNVHKVYFDYCVEKIVNYIKFLNGFRRYTSKEQIKNDLHSTIGFISGCSSNCRNGSEYFFGFSRRMIYEIVWDIERNQEKLFDPNTGLSNEALERLFFSDYAEKVDSLGLEKTMEEVFRRQGCHTEWLDTVDVIGPHLMEVREGEFEIMCGASYPFGRDAFALRFAAPLIANDPKYRYCNGYFVPIEDYSLPVYQEWRGAILSFKTQAEKEDFIKQIPWE